MKNFVAEVEIEQKYQNKEETALEVIYNFPVEEEAAVIGCSALLDGETIVATIQENEKAEKMYKKAIESNKTAVKLSSTRPDIFQMKVGNLSPGAECTITVKYIMELPVEDKKTRLTIPTTIAPKYVTDRPHTSSVVPEVLQNILYKDETPAPLKFNLSIEMKTKIVDISSPSHEIVVDNHQDGFEATASFDGTTKDMDRDIVILIDSEEPNKPKVVVEKSSDGTVVGMISMVPNFELKKQPSECIFLIDCSGSMRGSSIQLAKEALSVFIHSLPVDAHFNIICFGSRKKDLFHTSKALTDESLAEATNLIKRIDADLGGTEIYSPLESIFLQPKIVGKPRQVFVITDGDVSNSSECINLVNKHSSNNRVFTLGIGSSADRHLVKGMARAGRGTSVFTDFNENVSGKVVKQLKDALHPCIFDVELDWANDDSDLEFCQAPMKIQPLYDGTRMLVYRMWANDIDVKDSVNIKAKTPQGELSEEVRINTEDFIEGDMVHKMFARKMIQDLEERFFSEEKTKDEVNQVITKLALKYSLASRNTSFIGISSKANDIEGIMISRQVHNQTPSGKIVDLSRMVCGSARPKPRPLYQGIMTGMAGSCGAPAPPVSGCARPPRFGRPQSSFFCPPPPPPGSCMMYGLGAPSPYSSVSDDDEEDDDDEDDDDDWGIFDSVSEPLYEGKGSVKLPGKDTKKFKNNMEKVLHFASLQNAAGAFKQSNAAVELIGEDKVEIFKKQCETSNISLENWWTALIIAFIEINFPDEKDTWELFIQKASDWLNNSNIIKNAKTILQ